MLQRKLSTATVGSPPLFQSQACSASGDVALSPDGLRPPVAGRSNCKRFPLWTQARTALMPKVQCNGERAAGTCGAQACRPASNRACPAARVKRHSVPAKQEFRSQQTFNLHPKRDQKMVFKVQEKLCSSLTRCRCAFQRTASLS